MGKTGTAEKPYKGGYHEKRLVTSFVAAFPYEDPTYVVMITYDEPKDRAYARREAHNRPHCHEPLWV